MLPRKFRLTVFEFRKNPSPLMRLLSNSFTIHAKKSNKKFSRFAIIVPKRVDKRAYLRNQTKRITVEAIRRNLGHIEVAEDVLIKLKRIVKKEERKTFEEEIAKIFIKARLFKEKSSSS